MGYFATCCFMIFFISFLRQTFVFPGIWGTRSDFCFFPATSLKGWPYFVTRVAPRNFQQYYREREPRHGEFSRETASEIMLWLVCFGTSICLLLALHYCIIAWHMRRGGGRELLMAGFQFLSPSLHTQQHITRMFKRLALGHFSSAFIEQRQ